MLNIEDESNKSDTQKKPKIALCLSSLSGGKNDIGRDSGGIDYSFSHFKKHILEKNGGAPNSFVGPLGSYAVLTPNIMHRATSRNLHKMTGLKFGKKIMRIFRKI